MKNIAFKIDDGLHKALKVGTSMEGKSIAGAIIDLIKEKYGRILESEDWFEIAPTRTWTRDELDQHLADDELPPKLAAKAKRAVNEKA